ncbi:MAG TPA: glycosyltransferase family 2 protein [Candidatus Lumbricidophila sp.]|nr:glycosyltransferase family 2 protein [Candidatus Lumbricidophila sp.]
MSDNVRATVAILTYNGEAYLEAILQQLRAQRFDGGFEILIIDSGSTDRTLDIIGNHPDVRLIEIPNSEFGHGRTRNLAAREAKGEFVAFLTHDAVPGDERWLAELIEPFDRIPAVVAVMGKQVARDQGFPLQRYEIHQVFAGFGPDFGVTVFWDGPFAANNQGIADAIAFYSDVNSAARRDFLVNIIQYQDVRYAEDQLFGRDVIAAGHLKAYAPRAWVRHSNDLSLSEYGHRMFDEIVGLREIGTPLVAPSSGAVLGAAARGALADSRRIVRDGQYSWRRKLYWLAVNPFFHLRRWESIRRGALVDIEDRQAVRAGSLEHKRKRG